MTDSRPRLLGSALERALRLFTEVRSGEGGPALRMLASLFALVAANAVVKPARDGFLAAESIAGISEMELKAYTSFAQALLLFGLVPAYAAFSARVPRSTLVTRVTLGFAAMLVVFWGLRPGLVFDDVRFCGIVFYLWVGVFNVFAVSQFWVFGADLHSPEGGRRLFPLIGIGASAGAAAGSWAARELLGSGIADTYALLLVAALLVVASVVLLGQAEQASGRTPSARPWVPAEPTLNAIRLVLARRALWAMALVVLLVNWVKANSDNLLFAVVQEVLRDEAAARSLGEDFLRDGTTAFYAGFFFWVNLGSLVLQAFVASRLLRFGGFRVLFLILPTVSLLGYSALLVAPTLFVFRLAKIAEDAPQGIPIAPDPNLERSVIKRRRRNR